MFTSYEGNNFLKNDMFIAKAFQYIQISHSDALPKRINSIILSCSLIILKVMVCIRPQNNFWCKKYKYMYISKLKTDFG